MIIFFLQSLRQHRIIRDKNPFPWKSHSQTLCCCCCCCAPISYFHIAGILITFNHCVRSLSRYTYSFKTQSPYTPALWRDRNSGATGLNWKETKPNKNQTIDRIKPVRFSFPFKCFEKNNAKVWALSMTARNRLRDIRLIYNLYAHSREICVQIEIDRIHIEATVSSRYYSRAL